MHRPAALTALVLLCLPTVLLSAGMAAPAKPQATKAISAKPADRNPASAAEGREALDSAVAAAVVGALSEQFAGRAVKIKLDSTDVQITSIRDRTVSGEGRLQIDNEDDWIGFRYRALYDTYLGNASYPELTIGGIAEHEREVPNDSALVRELDDRVVGLLAKEFGHQQVRLQLDRISTVEAGKRFLRISAFGIADFGREGNTNARVDAMYDRRENAWLRVTYDLGTTANWSSEGATTAR